MTLFRRDWSLQVGSLLIAPSAGQDDLTIRFDIKKSTGREPNRANIQIVNLSKARRDQIEAMDDPDIELIAGFGDGQSETIFAGDAGDHWSALAETEWTTYFEASDGGRSYRTAVINQSFAPGTPLASVINACAEAMGVGLGNSASVAAAASLDSGGDNYPSGTALNGRAHLMLTRVCSSASLRWSVQNGVLQLRPRGRAAETNAVLLNSSTGLIGSPTRGRVDRRTRRVTYGATSLLRTGLYPGRVVTIESKAIERVSLMVKTTHAVGDTTENDWLVEMELQEYDAVPTAAAAAAAAGGPAVDA